MTAWDHETDVVAIGSGAGGMTAALTARLLGSEALVVERGEQFGGTTAMSGGAIWVPCNHLMAEAGLDDSPDDAHRYLTAVTRGRTSDGKLRAYLRAAPAMVRWLAERSHVRFVALKKYPDYYPETPGGRLGGRSLEAEPFDGRKLGRDFFRLRPPHPQECIWGRVMMSAAEAHEALFGGKEAQAAVVRKLIGYFFNVWERLRWRRDTRLAIGNALAARLRLSLAEQKVPLWLSTRVTRFVVEAGRVVGVEVLRDGRTLRIRARRGVVLASGGFAQNAALRQEHQRAPIGSEWTAAAGDDQGDALALGEQVGAATDLLDESWWTPTTVVPGETVPWILVVEKSLPGSLIVNRAGKRFTNEAAPYLDVVQGIYRDQEATGAAVPAYLVLDARCRRKYPLGPVMPGSMFPEWLWKRRWTAEKWLAKADSIGELADKIGVDRAGLQETVRVFNTYCARGVDPEFHRGESAYDRYYASEKVKPNPALGALGPGPFYAIPVWPGDLGTKGGLVTDERGRVLDASGAPVEGLFAVGNASASVMGLTYPGAGGTIGPAMTFGWLAAHEACGASSPD